MTHVYHLNSLAQCRERVGVRDIVWRNCLARHTSDSHHLTGTSLCEIPLSVDRTYFSVIRFL
jgi:hypothetical protein